MEYTSDDALNDSLLSINEEDLSIHSINLPFKLNEGNIGKEFRKCLEKKRMILFADNVLNMIEDDILKSNILKSSSNKIKSTSSLSLYKYERFSIMMEKLPIIIDLKLHEYLNTNMSLADSSLKQLILDIGRDKIIVNGYNIIGSEEGLDGCIKKISYIIDILTNEMNIETINDSIKEEISIKILKLASRTNSGGVAYQTLSHIINTEINLITPISNLARPLIIKLSIGSFRDKNGYKTIGLECNVLTSYFFNIISLEHENDKGKLKCTYQNTIYSIINDTGFNTGNINQSNNIQVNNGYVNIENCI